MSPANDTPTEIKRPRAAARPVTLTLYPRDNYCRLEDPIAETCIESTLDQLYELNEGLLVHRLWLDRITGTPCPTGPPGPKAPPSGRRPYSDEAL